MRPSASARVLLADHHATVREGLCALFALVPEVEVVGQAADAATTLERAAALAPDVVVIDPSLPGGGGIDTVARLQAVTPPPAVVVLTPRSDPRLVREALAAGSAAYVLTHSGFAALRQAIETAVRGQRYIDPAVAGGLEVDRADSSAGPSGRELDVLRRAALGQSNKAIAAGLAISVRTVEAHKTHGMRKLGLHGRRDLLSYAVAREWFADA